MILSDANTIDALKQRVEQDSFAVVPACLDAATVELLGSQFDDTRHPERNLLSIPSVRALAISRAVREIVVTVLVQSALRSGGFSSIRRDAQIEKWFGTKI